MYKIISKVPTKDNKEFVGGSLCVTRLWVGLLDDYMKVRVRIYWYDLVEVIMMDMNGLKIIKRLYPHDLFDMNFLRDPKHLQCDLSEDE